MTDLKLIVLSNTTQIFEIFRYTAMTIIKIIINKIVIISIKQMTISTYYVAALSTTVDFTSTKDRSSMDFFKRN